MIVAAWVIGVAAVGAAIGEAVRRQIKQARQHEDAIQAALDEVNAHYETMRH